MLNISKTQVNIATHLLCSGLLTHLFNSCINLTAQEKDQNTLSKLYLSWCLSNAVIILMDHEIKVFSNSLCQELNIEYNPIERVADWCSNIQKTMSGQIKDYLII
jgi:hypothetical protein